MCDSRAYNECRSRRYEVTYTRGQGESVPPAFCTVLLPVTTKAERETASTDSVQRQASHADQNSNLVGHEWDCNRAFVERLQHEITSGS